MADAKAHEFAKRMMEKPKPASLTSDPEARIFYDPPELIQIAFGGRPLEYLAMTPPGSRLTVTVPTGTRSEYRFSQSIATANPLISVETAPEGHEGHGHQYVTFDGRGATAILRLMERTAQLEQFFRDVCKISVCELHSGLLQGFIEREYADEDDFEEAYERVAQMVEEQIRKEDIEAGRIGFVRD